MIAAKRTHADRSLIQSYLVSGDAPNQTEVCGVFRFALGLKPHCDKQLPLCLDVLPFVVRHRLRDWLAEEVAVLAEFFDSTLVQAYLAAKKQGVTPRVFIELHSSLVALVLNMPDVHKMLAVEDSWDSVAVELTRIVGSLFQYGDLVAIEFNRDKLLPTLL